MWSIAVGHNYPDALAAGPPPPPRRPDPPRERHRRPAVTEAELNRHPESDRRPGWPAAISDAVVAYLDDRFPTVVRRSGLTRYGDGSGDRGGLPRHGEHGVHHHR
jgi:hypothetical protein